MSATLCGPAHEEVMAQVSSENFPVASALLPAGQRQALLAIYGVARLIDDVGDEAPGDRSALLDRLEDELERVFSGGRPEHGAMRALAAALRSHPLPEAPFRALVEANRQDQEVTRYETFEQLLGYCRLSAAPVGELVLHVFGFADPGRLELSERVCAGLQVIEHMQDVREDYLRGRVYMPARDMERCGCSEQDLASPEPIPARRALLVLEAGRASALLDEGAPLALTLPARPRVAVACFVAGGRSALHALRRSSYDSGRGSPPRRTRRAFATAFARAVRGK